MYTVNKGQNFCCIKLLMKYCSTDQTMIMKSNTLTNHVAIFYYPILRGKKSVNARGVQPVYTEQYSSEGGAHYPVQQMQYQTVQCKADDCNNPIHAEMGIPPRFGAFEYCSPQCRDRHMLPGLQVQDIQTLQEIASHSTTSATDYRSYSAVTDDGSPETTSKSSKCMVGNFTFSEIIIVNLYCLRKKIKGGKKSIPGQEVNI